MQKTTLPGTDLLVSRICLGAMRFSGSTEAGTCDITWGATDQATINATIAAALDAGVNFFDCAPAVLLLRPTICSRGPCGGYHSSM